MRTMRAYQYEQPIFQGPQILLRHFSFTVGDGRVVMDMPNRLAKEDWEHVEQMVALIMRSVKRAAHLEQQL